MPSSYQQAEKNAVRERILPAAIVALTSDRHRSGLIREEELIPTVEFFLAALKRATRSDAHRDKTLSELALWLDYHSSRIGTKKSQSLRVLYLSGPEPLNDLNVMTQAGVNPHNVWAVTGKEDHATAVAACSEAGVPLKIHRGSLAEFFDVFNETFDIIYFDACGPIAGSKPNTLDPIISILDRQRLNSPGVLITNFCESPDDGDARDRYVDLVTAFFAPRYNDLPRIVHEAGYLDPQEFQHEYRHLHSFAAKNLEPLYSHFITRFITDLGMNLVPNCRALSMGALFRSYLMGEKEFKEVRGRADDPTMDLSRGKLPGELLLSPSSYPIPSFVRILEELRKDDPVLNRLKKPLTHQQRSLRDLVKASALLDHVIEGHWDILSDAMKLAVATSWFDRGAGITCDSPLPNLIVNSLLGIYGKPWFANTRSCDRVTYIAKKRRMYCDLFVLDQCRSYFDWFPTVHACPARFESVPFQIVARCILDRIERHDFRSEAHPFRGAAVIGHHEHEVAQWYNFKDRDSIL
ncbi:hypothetical protein NZK35_05435 [Stieleria sp. ICT_E10.1]|uniref:hypothetical protein n=1 Tax=Stieleria sedimenti TaxID=2976331 RepID=UPI00217FF7AA|nr:hypothetical protein [Stieleria sedimenti]MCS7466115.1 hypothetical protein [Stieleria sedimenti]